jgi:hypothetical protein
MMLYFLAFSIAMTNTCEKRFKGGRIYFGSQFQRSQSMLACSVVFWPEVRSYVMAEGHGGVELLTSWQPGYRSNRKGPGARYTPFQGMTPVTYFLHPAPYLHHLPTVCSNSQSINELNNQLVQSPHGLIFLKIVLTHTVNYFEIRNT